uniref:Gustatory receptor n=1 Tax=Strongyloides papillosus TaxID=174720 RepID=A0A0N5C197_STREA
MDDLDISFRSAFKVTPNVKPYKIVFILAILITIIVTTTLRVIEHASTQQGTYYFSKQFIFSLVVIPLLSIWNMIPLLYYEICNRLIRFWCRHLSEHIEKETQSRKFTIRFYYEQFLRITKLQRAVGNTFNPFIFFCLAWSLILLCFTIYLSTEKIDNLVEPLPDLSRKNVSEEISRRILTQRVIFTLLWTSVQVVLSLLNIFVICATGMKTNEQTRKIVNAILGIVPIIETDSDRFQVQCFIHKMQTQYIWGMNVWRTVPLERTTFFTIVSVIVTYSVLLFKLHESRHISPAIQKGINITQS